MYLYNDANMEPAPPSAVFAGPMNLGAWQDKARSMGYETEAKAIKALKDFIRDYFKPDNPDVQFLVRQGLIADTSEPVLAYYGLTRILGYTESDARDFVATAYPVAVAASAAAAQETHDVELVQKDVNKANVIAAQELAQANAAAAAAAAAQAKADAEKSQAAIAAANAAAAAAAKAQAEAVQAKKDLDAVKAALADQVKIANAQRAAAGQAPITVNASGAQTGGANLPLLLTAAYYLFLS